MVRLVCPQETNMFDAKSKRAVVTVIDSFLDSILLAPPFPMRSYLVCTYTPTDGARLPFNTQLEPRRTNESDLFGKGFVEELCRN